MKAIVIGASSESIYAIKKAQAMGIEVHALDGSSDALGLKHANYSHVIDISDEKAVIEYVAKYKIDFILPVAIGRFLTTTGKVNDAFKMKGISYAAAQLCVDKWQFHKTLAQENLRAAECYLYDAKSTDLHNTVFPAIAKPRFGSGSKGVVEIVSLKEADSFIKNLSEEYLIEEKVAGIEFGIDAQVINNELQIILIRKKENTPPPYMQAVAYYSCYENIYQGDFERDVQKLLASVVKVLKLNDCLMHVDLMVSEEKLFIIELSGRPSGHNLHNNFTVKATNFNMIENFINYQLRGINNYAIQLEKMCIHYFDLEPGIIIKVPTPEELATLDIVEYVCHLKKGDCLKTITDGPTLMKRGYYIIKGETLEELEEKVLNIKTLFTIRRKDDV